MKDRGFKIVTIAALLIAVLGLSIGYATYTENLKISGTVTARASSNAWNVKFENISEAELGGIANEMVAPDLTSTIISKFTKLSTFTNTIILITRHLCISR